VDDRGEVHESASIITREAVGFLATVHHRMPTFLPADRWDLWLNPDLKNVDEIRDLMNFDIPNPTIATPDAHLAAYPVATLVNSTRNNGPELIKEIELGESQTLF
jgi:putative SOS response-associated peptidase YedK